MNANPYASGSYVYTPAFTLLFAIAILPFGLIGVQIAHLASLPSSVSPLTLALTVLTPRILDDGGSCKCLLVHHLVRPPGNARFSMGQCRLSDCVCPTTPPARCTAHRLVAIRDEWVRVPALGIGILVLAANLVTGLWMNGSGRHITF